MVLTLVRTLKGRINKMKTKKEEKYEQEIKKLKELKAGKEHQLNLLNSEMDTQKKHWEALINQLKNQVKIQKAYLDMAKEMQERYSKQMQVKYGELGYYYEEGAIYRLENIIASLEEILEKNAE